jgi:hypothetical protein
MNNPKLPDSHAVALLKKKSQTNKLKTVQPMSVNSKTFLTRVCVCVFGRTGD